MAALDKKKLLRIFTLFLTALALLAFPEVIARPGGGGGYSGGGGGYSGGGSYGGGGGGGDGAALFYLLVKYPQIGVPVLIIIVTVSIYRHYNQPNETIISGGTIRRKRAHIWETSRKLGSYQQERDENFSTPLFLDFVQHLYYQFHHWRGSKALHNMGALINSEIIGQNSHVPGAKLELTELVIGAIDITDFSSSSREYDFITVEIDANYTETRAGHSNRFQVIDRWSFRRKKAILSKPPAEMQHLGCPNCGSPLELRQDNSCAHCGQVVSPGDKQWELIRITPVKRKIAPAQQFGHYEAERGNFLPTVYDNKLGEKIAQFAATHKLKDEQLYWVNFIEQVVKPVFRKIYESWAKRKWEPARPLMSDFLFQSHYYWIAAYEKAGLYNKLDDLKIDRVEPVKLGLDKFYESMTLRIRASVKDYVVDESGRLIGGNKYKRRSFSEYWTFIRRTGVDKSPDQYSTDNCPNCGAPVDMGMSGVCSYCHSKVSTGEFGWILSRITQDEVYYG